MNIKELLNQGKNKLNQKEDSILISKILLAHFLKKDKQYLMIQKEQIVPKEIQQEYEKAIEKIAEGYPWQYITHQQEFMKLNFYVDENVLIPRPDTETLVEEILNLVSKEKQVKILDICTGSGAIGIALAKYLPNASIYMVDISEKALDIAKKNATINGVEERVKLIQSDMFQNIPNTPFDIIVSNPPYIETETILVLEKQVQQEPRIALDGGEDGLSFYRILIKESQKFLKKEGVIGLEIGYNQKEEVIRLLEQEGVYQDIYCKKDLGGNNRIILGKLV